MRLASNVWSRADRENRLDCSYGFGKTPVIKKILIANRGEIAVRIVRACAEMGIRSVAIYSDADRHALHVKRADEAHSIGAEPLAGYLNPRKLVNLAVDGGIDATEIGKNVAMQIAALNPRFWDKSQVTDEVLAEEKKIALALMDTDPKMASKPEAVKEKIVMGKMNKFYEENCLLQMEFVRSDIFQGSVEKYIADAAKKLGGSVKFVDAVRFQTGEGIEKKQEDFAAEVAAQMNMGK